MCSKQPDQTLGALLKHRREGRDISQEQLAFDAGITVSALSKIERGRQAPGWITVAKIAKAMGISLAELATEFEQAVT